MPCRRNDQLLAFISLFLDSTGGHGVGYHVFDDLRTRHMIRKVLRKVGENSNVEQVEEELKSSFSRISESTSSP